MKVALVSLFAVLCLVQATSADYSLGSCTYTGGSESAVSATVSTALSVVGNVCLGVIATLGLNGCLALLNGVVGSIGVAGSIGSLLCVNEINAYVEAVLGVFIDAGIAVQAVAGGALTYVDTVTITASELTAKLTAALNLAGLVTAGVTIGAGLILGVSATVGATLVAALSALVVLCAGLVGTIGVVVGGVAGTAVGFVGCVADSCL